MKRIQVNQPAAPKKKLGWLALAAVIFFTISGGPFGIEPLIGYAGNFSLILLAVTPLLWDIPSILMVMELNSMIPVSGGYYQWVRKALGLRWAFYEGWWTWLYSFVDLAIYPVFFVEYAAFFFPGIAAYKIPVCLAVVWINAGLNIRGILTVGKSALGLIFLVIIPFAGLFIYVVSHHAQATTQAPPVLNHASLGLALYTIMWNYIGWDNATTYAGEVNKPVRSYLVSMLMAFCCIYLLYLIAAYTALHSGLSFDSISENGFPYVGLRLGGRWVASLLSLGGMASMLGIFSSILLSVSRIPAAMSEDKILPAVLSRQHPRYDSPYISIILCAVVVSFLIMFSIADLLVMDITLYAAGLSLEFISLIVLRIKLPDEKRPFRIPLKTPGLILMAILPFIVFTIALTGVLTGSGLGFKPAVIALLALFSAEIGWLLIKWKRSSLNKNTFP